MPEDSASITEHNKAIVEELKKTKPRDTLLLSLMKSTFHSRRMFIHNDAANVADVLQHYPALVRPAVVNFILFGSIDIL